MLECIISNFHPISARTSSQWHTLPKRDYMHSISEVIILNNDQHQHKKLQQQTTGLIQRLSNNIQLMLIGVIVSEKFCFRKCLLTVYKFALQGQQFSCQTGKGIGWNMPKYSRASCEEDELPRLWQFLGLVHWKYGHPVCYCWIQTNLTWQIP